MTQGFTVEFEFSGKTKVIIIIVVLLILTFRLISIGEVTDKSVLTVIKSEISTEWSRKNWPAVEEALTGGDFDGSGTDAEDFMTPDIVLHKVKASKPLLSISSSQDVIYEVNYSIEHSIGGVKREVKYFLFQHSLLGDPIYKWESSKIIYYINSIY